MAASKPTAVLFDVNQTLFDLKALESRLLKVLKLESCPNMLELWFNTVLRDGMAATAAGSFVGFREVAEHHLRQIVSARHPTLGSPGVEAEVYYVISAMHEIPPFSDVVPAIQELHAAGIKVAALTNGTKQIAEELLQRAGVRKQMTAVMEVAEAGAWKPANAPYLHACKTLGLPPEEVLLVAVHPWDTHGAKAAGLKSAFVARSGEAYPPYFSAPDATISSLTQLAGMLY